MNEDLFKLHVDGELVGSNMKMETALLLINKMFDFYYNERDFSITITRQRDDELIQEVAR